MTKSYLRTRWKAELKSVNDLVTYELENKGVLTRLELPETTEGLIDLRGYSAPKKYRTEKSNSGRDKTYVSEGIRIKKMTFEKIDFSYSDFEGCEFLDCNFSKSKFDKARFFATQFWGCRFHDITFSKTNFGHSTFQTGGIILKRIIDNFTHVTFEFANLSEVHVHDQTFQDCKISDSKTGGLLLSKCVFHDLSFSGSVKNLFITNSRQVKKVDFTNAFVIGINLEKQTLNGFHFPEGDNYYMFRNKSKELANLKIKDHLADDERKIIETIISVWSTNNLNVEFVDINWLKPNEVNVGKTVIKELKRGVQSN